MSQQVEEGIYKVDSKIPGPVTVLMAGVHGDEQIAYQALWQWKEKRSIGNGVVYIIFANLKALEQKQRYIDKNMNRCFVEKVSDDTYEERRVSIIKSYLKRADFLLDIHNTESTESSIPFLISEHTDIKDFLDIPFVVSGFDALHLGGSDGYMNNLGKKGFCLESGSLFDIKGASRQITFVQENIRRFLIYTGNIKGNIPPQSEPTVIEFNFLYTNKTMNFSFSKKYQDFEKISRGECICTDGKLKIYAQKDGYILFARNPKNIGSECFCLGTKK